MAVFSNTETDYFVRQLECPVCLVTMRPPIFLCPTGHSICNKCYDTVKDCPQCKVSYGKVERDSFEGGKVMNFKCDNNCDVSDIDGGNRYRIDGRWEISNVTCRVCSAEYNVVPYKGKLVLADKFAKMKREFRPQQNYSLESMTACVLYPCEAEQCVSKVKLSEQKEHQSVCIYRTIECPSVNCGWLGPLSSLNDHFLKPLDKEDDDDDYVNDRHYMAQKQVKFKLSWRRHVVSTKVVCFKDETNFPDSLFVFALHIPHCPTKSISLTHYGTAADSRNIDGKVTMFSHKDPSYCRSFSFPVSNDLETENNSSEEELPSRAWLMEHHFINDDFSLIFEVDFWRKTVSESSTSVVISPVLLHVKEERKDEEVKAGGKGRKRGRPPTRRESHVRGGGSKQTNKKQTKKEPTANFEDTWLDVEF